MTDKLTDAIDQLVQEKTFKLDALEAIGKLRSRAAAQEQEINALTAQRTEQYRTISELAAKIEENRQKEGALQLREGEVAKREVKAQQLEVEKAVAQAESRAYGTVFSTIFRNTAVREHVVRNEVQWVTTPSGPMSMNAPITETCERTAE